MATQTRSQQYAQQAYQCVSVRYSVNSSDMLNEKKQKEYKTFAKKFPALVHTCGLAQAVAFAEAKEHYEFLSDLAAVIKAARHSEIQDRQALSKHSRESNLLSYMRLSRNAITAASWIKRYVEAIATTDSEGDN